jgi:CRP-like cAMP-binding protein
VENILARFGWLAGCRPAFRAYVLAHLRHAEMQPGQTVSFAGDAEGGFYALEEGQIAFVITCGGSWSSLGHAGFPGTWWGQGPLIGVPRVGHAVTRTACRIAMLPLPLLRQRLAEVPGDWEALSLAYSDVFLMASGAHGDMLIPGHLRRLAAAILRLGGNRHRRFPVQVPSRFQCTQEELASAIGLSRNATGRLLRSLEADGLVDSRYGQLAILDSTRLQALIESA